MFLYQDSSTSRLYSREKAMLSNVFPRDYRGFQPLPFLLTVTVMTEALSCSPLSFLFISKQPQYLGVCSFQLKALGYISLKCAQQRTGHSFPILR